MASSVAEARGIPYDSAMHATILPHLVLTFACAMASTGNLARATDAFPVELSTEQQIRLERVLAEHDVDYDPAAKMLLEPLKSPGYHTTLKAGKIHGTRSALNYAVALLDSGDEKRLQRACDILRTVIALQDQNPTSKTYGIWSWFLEEPLDQMSPPDWNWADFCGVQLLQVALGHRSRLPPDLATEVDKAIHHAARSIQRRNVGPGYTNIAIMGTYVTLVAAELYGWADLKTYALTRLRGFHAHTRSLGGFSEYNSPTYSMVALAELGRMRLHVKDATAKPLIEEMYRMVWEDIAAHFHAPTRQWAGPHSRCYSSLLRAETLDRLQCAMGGKVDFGVDAPSMYDHGLSLPCPADLVPHFLRLEAPREVVKTYQKGERPIIGTTWLEPSFALGSVNRSEFWNQRRPLLAYWGTAERPSYLQVRFLRDGYDFSTVQFYSAQRKGDVLAAANFATDGGNTHLSLDRIKGGLFRAKDLRLRFEFGGAAGAERLSAPDRLDAPHVADFGAAQMVLGVTAAKFAAFVPRWEAGQSGPAAFLDVVLYEGMEREFRLGDLDEAGLGFFLRMASSAVERPVVQHAIEHGRLVQEWGELRIAIPLKPGPAGVLQRDARF